MLFIATLRNTSSVISSPSYVYGSEFSILETLATVNLNCSAPDKAPCVVNFLYATSLPWTDIFPASEIT